MKLDAAQLGKLVALGCEKYIGPLLPRLKKLEARDKEVAALEARVKRLEAALSDEP